MRLAQWIDPSAKMRHVGVVWEEDGVETAVSVTSVHSRIQTTIAALAWMEKIPEAKKPAAVRAALKKAARRPWAELLNTPHGGRRSYLLPPIDVPENPYAFTLWGAGVTHLRSAKAREEESRLVRGRPASFYDLMYQAGVENGKPARPPGARPEIFPKADGYYAVGPNQPVRIAKTAKRCVPEPEVVSYYAPKNSARAWRRIGYTLGDDFSDQGWESENPLYLPHAKVQRGLAAIGPVFVTSDDPLFDPREIAIRCRVYRAGKITQDSGSLRTGEKHMAHSLANLEFHLFDNRPFRPGEIRGLFWGTSAVFKQALTAGDLIEIEASSGLGTLRNPAATA